MADATKGYTNAFWSVLEPLMDGKQIQGTAQYVATEVLVGQAIRRIAFGLPYNWLAASETHLYSIPMIGQLNFGDPFGDLNRDSKKKVELSNEATAGAKAIPGALAGYLAHKVRSEGIRFPNFATSEVMALLIGKIVSRPLVAYIFSSLPKDMQTASIVLNELFNRVKGIVDAKQEDL